MISAIVAFSGHGLGSVSQGDSALRFPSAGSFESALIGMEYALHTDADLMYNRAMEILVIDGQGGGLGRSIVSSLKAKVKNAYVVAVGTNSLATGAMMKAGADRAATGENPVVVACRTADVIMGPVGIVIPDSMHGEITARMSFAIARSRAERVLIPVNLCSNHVVGVQNTPISAMIEEAVGYVASLGNQKTPAIAD